MIDVTQYGESDFINADLVKASPTKQFVVLDALEEDDNFNEGKKRLALIVELDEKRKTYNPNKDTIKNLALDWGSDASKWSGKIGIFKIISLGGKERVFAQAQ